MRTKQQPGTVPPEPMGLFAEGAAPPKMPHIPESAGTAFAKLFTPLLVALFFMLVAVPTGFLLQNPGPAFDLQGDIEIEGAETYASQGEFLLTSVSLRESNLLNHLISFMGGDFDFLKVRDYLGEELDTEGQEKVDAVITYLSQDTAVIAGLREVGQPVEVTEIGAFVVAVAPGYPAYGEVNPGEVIVEVNGEPVYGSETLGEIVGSTPEGQTITLQVKEINEALLDKAEKQVEEGLISRPDLSTLLEEGVREVRLQPVYSPERERSLIGISMRDYFSYSSGVEVEWQLERVKGPSAGLMMTLSLVNALTPDDLTQGDKIAGTGEISLDGDVGPIGGLTFKIRAAEREGARVFIYPVENQDELSGFSTHLKLFAVDDLSEALEVLRALD
jgi:Lon-like protease